MPDATIAPAQCRHCGQPLAGDEGGDFCCGGCEAVYHLLHDQGLTRYYDLRGESGVPVVLAASEQRPWLEEIEARVAERGACDLDVSGIHCAACVWVMEELFRRQEGAGAIELNPTLGRMHLRVGPDFPLRAYVEEVERLGYRFGPPKKQARRASDGLLLRTGVAFALAGNTMLFALATYFGLRDGPLHELLQELSYAAGALSVLVGGGVFFRAAWQGLRARTLHLDLPIALGIGLAFLGATYRFFWGGGEAAYVDTLTVFIALMLLGRFLQERTLERNRDRLLADEGVDGLVSRRERSGQVETIKSAAILAGDRLLLAPGDLVPVDARLLDAGALCSLDWIDGESAPREYDAGDVLPAGAFNAGDRAIRVEALTDFDASVVLRLLASSDASVDGRAQPAATRFWSHVSSVYVVGVLLAASAGGVGWYLATGDLAHALGVATAVLVVTCPCAFGIAVPLGYELARATLRRRGLFLRAAGALDRMRQVRRVVFDKTGTLTTGALRLVAPEALDELTELERDRLYALATGSSHPKALALSEALAARGASVRPSRADEAAIERTGHGVELGADGRRYRLGAVAFVAPGARREPCGESDFAFGVDGALRVELPTRETRRPAADRELARLADEGYETFILSGDLQSKVTALAAELGVPGDHALGEHRPEDKAGWLRAHDAEHTLMIGDGLNDGLAVREALVSGTPAIDRPFMASRCDFYLVSPGLGPIADALDTARRLGRVVRFDLAFAAVYNLAAASVALAGWMRPWMAAVLMPTSSLLTIGFTLFAMTRRDRRGRRGAP